jgi:carboxymethylenebutenolidase
LHAGYETNGVYTDAFLARPVDGAPRPGVVLLSGMFGLSWTQREITRIYARAGFVALSPDYLGGQRPSGRTDALHAKNSLEVNRAVDQLAGGAAFLRSLPWVGPEGKVGIMGFCLGGGLVLLAAARTDAFQAGVVYHQSLFPDERELAGIDCKLQCHYGTEDHSTTGSASPTSCTGTRACLTASPRSPRTPTCRRASGRRLTCHTGAASSSSSASLAP